MATENRRKTGDTGFWSMFGGKNGLAGTVQSLELLLLDTDTVMNKIILLLSWGRKTWGLWKRGERSFYGLILGLGKGCDLGSLCGKIVIYVH
jgi:hypothetical protein